MTQKITQPTHGGSFQRLEDGSLVELEAATLPPVGKTERARQAAEAEAKASTPRATGRTTRNANPET